MNRRVFCVDLLQKGALAIGVGTLFTRCASTSEQSTNTPSEEPVQEVIVSENSVSNCSDISQVDPAEIQKREALGYVEKTPIPDNNCANCKLFIPAKDATSCGGCMLFKGPVVTDGYCTYWADPIS